MRLGLKVNPAGWDDASDWAGIAESAGFDGLWTGDNLRNPRDPAIPVLDGPTVITGWAAITSRIRVGLLIGNLVFRHPTVLAKQATDDGPRVARPVRPRHRVRSLADGPRDGRGTAVDGEERTERLSEFVAVVSRLLAGDVSDHDGPYYPYSQASMAPGTVQEPAAADRRGECARRWRWTAAHGDGWTSFPRRCRRGGLLRGLGRTRAEVLDELLGGREIRRILLAYGKLDPWASVDGFARLVERYRGVGFNELVVYAPKEHEREVFDQVAAKLDSFR